MVLPKAASVTHCSSWVATPFSPGGIKDGITTAPRAARNKPVKSETRQAVKEWLSQTQVGV
jgi:hypothetical protein